MNFFEKLKNRNIFRISAAYIVSAWLLIQVADTVFPYLGLSEKVITWVIFALVFGIVPTLVFAWLYEITPKGIERESDIERPKGEVDRVTRNLNRAILLLLLAGVSYFAYDKFVLDPVRDRARVEEAVASAIELAEQAAAEAEEASVAVLPFLNLSSDPEQEYFSDGLAEELLNLLSDIPELRVAARSSSFAFRGRESVPSEVSSQLGVSHLLEGSVRKAGRELRITAKLVRGSDGTQLWSETYEGTVDDVFATQDRIAASVLDSLKLTLLGERPVKRIVDPEAYALFLQGRYFAERRDQENWQKASDAFKAALEIDPKYAEAWAELAITYSQQASWGFIERDAGFAQAREAVRQALALDPELAIAHAALGWIRMVYDFDFHGADSAYQEAMRLAPGDATVLRAAAVLAFSQGRLDESIEISLRAIVRDPLNQGTHQNLALVLMHAGRLDDSEQKYRHVLELNEAYPGAHMRLGQIHLLRGDAEAALEIIPRDSDPWWVDYGVALALSKTDRKADAQKALDDFIEQHPDGPVQVAKLYAFRGQIDNAFEWLETAYQQRDSGLHEILNDPFLLNLHDDPRWPAFLQKMGLGNIPAG